MGRAAAGPAEGRHLRPPIHHTPRKIYGMAVKVQDPKSWILPGDKPLRQRRRILSAGRYYGVKPPFFGAITPPLTRLDFKERSAD